MKKNDDTSVRMDDQSVHGTDEHMDDDATDTVDDSSVMISTLTAERDDWKSKALRALADYQNLLRRTNEERIEDQKYAGAATMMQLFPAIDLLMTASVHIQDEGFALALKELDTKLTKLGLEILDPIGSEFDIETMECIEANGTSTKVTSVASRGYRMHGRVLRAAKVIVGTKEESKKQNT